MPSSSAPALPTLVTVSMTLTPWPRASSTVLSVDASDTTCTFRAGTSAVMAARESSMTTSSLWAAMSTATSSMVRILPAARGQGRPARPPLAAAWMSRSARSARCAAQPAFRGRRRNLSSALSTTRRKPTVPQMVKLTPNTSANISQTRSRHSPRGPCSRPVPGESTSFGCRSRFTQPHPNMADTRGLAASCCAATSWMMSASDRLGGTRSAAGPGCSPARAAACPRTPLRRRTRRARR